MVLVSQVSVGVHVIGVVVLGAFRLSGLVLATAVVVLGKMHVDGSCSRFVVVLGDFGDGGRRTWLYSLT